MRAHENDHSSNCRFSIVETKGKNPEKITKLFKKKKKHNLYGFYEKAFIH
jgi:hypothetical protein